MYFRAEINQTMKKKYIFILLILGFVSLSIKSQTISLQAFGPNFPNPTNMSNAGDDRLFIVDQEGYIRILKANGTTPSYPFLDIEDRVNNQEDSWEAGLLGLTFHPNYSSNGYFYVFYVNLENTYSIVSRFTVDSGNPDFADPSSELIILNIPIFFGYTHFGGDLHFDDNGYLYISTGDDGTTEGDTGNFSQNLNSLKGKILRIDVDNPASGKNYGTPNSNPFKNDGDPNTLEEIWSIGLRNPAKFSFDSLNGDFWVADVGHTAWEEVNIDLGNNGNINYGWPCYEANTPFNNDTPVSCPSNSSLDFPINTYGHFEPDGIFRCAIIGGYRYRGSNQSNLFGKYFFADWCSNEIFILTESGGSWTREHYQPSIGIQRWTSFGEGNNKELYVIGNSGGSGQVYKIVQETLSTGADEFVKFNIIPNPSNNGLVSLDFPNTVLLKDINIYNLQGQKIASKFETNTSKSYNLDLGYLSSGIYIIETISNKGEKSLNKLIIK